MSTEQEDLHIGKLENRVTKLEEGQQTLIAGMSRIETIASQLIDNQKGVFNRINRPWQWGVIVAVFAVLVSLASVGGTIITLIVTPIKETIADIQEEDTTMDNRNRNYHDAMTNEIHKNAIDAAVNREALRWLEKVEERYFMTSIDEGPSCCRVRKPER